MEPRVIFHKTGEITLQVPGFSRTYQGAKKCAQDITEYLENEDSCGMVSDDHGAMFGPHEGPSEESIRNVEFIVVNLADIVEMIHFCEDTEFSYDPDWTNVTALYRALE